jgi:hypothetical protein
VKRLEILYELLTRDVPTIVVRQEIERRRIVFRVTLEEDTEIGVADAAEHEARHVAGSYLRPALTASARAAERRRRGGACAALCSEFRARTVHAHGVHSGHVRSGTRFESPQELSHLGE